MKWKKLLLLLLVLLASSLFVFADSNITQDTGGGGASSNASSLAGSGSLPLIAGGKTYKNLFFSEPVKSIEFEVSENVWTGRPFSEKVIYLPKGVNYLDNLRNVYSYFRITSDKINQSNIVFAKVKFNVENTWLENNDLVKDDIELLIYDHNGWTDKGVTTEYFGENSEDIFYITDVPYFGYFAIAEKKKETLVVEPAEEVQEIVEIVENDIVINEKPNDYKDTAFIALVLVVVGLLVVYLNRKKN